jgi:hypothetical protein
MYKANKRFTKVAIALLLTLALLVVPLTVAFAAGQPGKSCEDPGMITPGQSASAPGSAFNPDGHAGTVYAGEQPQNSNNVHSVSQYDVACFQVSQH